MIKQHENYWIVDSHIAVFANNVLAEKVPDLRMKLDSKGKIDEYIVLTCSPFLDDLFENSKSITTNAKLKATQELQAREIMYNEIREAITQESIHGFLN